VDATERSSGHPQEAFYVKCDSETNPAEVIDAGQLVVEIGIAPSSRPSSWSSASPDVGGASLTE